MYASPKSDGDALFHISQHGQCVGFSSYYGKEADTHHSLPAPLRGIKIGIIFNGCGNFKLAEASARNKKDSTLPCRATLLLQSRRNNRKMFTLLSVSMQFIGMVLVCVFVAARYGLGAEIASETHLTSNRAFACGCKFLTCFVCREVRDACRTAR